MRNILVIITIFCTTLLQGQQTTEWLNKLNNPEYSIDKLKTENLVSKYQKYDFSTLLTPRTDFIGYIGSDFKRIQIFYSSICKDQADPKIYNVKGVSIVGSNVCDFGGTISVDAIREYETMHFGVDLKYKDDGLKAQGILIGKYSFKENQDQKHSGTFTGIITLRWYVDKFGLIHYDDIQFHSDRYRNNQYIGIWEPYKGDYEKKCNWGEYRIPFSGDLDIGAGGFSPNSKYHDKGWKDYEMR